MSVPYRTALSIVVTLAPFYRVKCIVWSAKRALLESNTCTHIERTCLIYIGVTKLSRTLILGGVGGEGGGGGEIVSFVYRAVAVFCRGCRGGPAVTWRRGEALHSCIYMSMCRPS